MLPYLIQVMPSPTQTDGPDRGSHPARTTRPDPKCQDRLVGLRNPYRVLSLERTGIGQPGRRRHPGALDDREHLPLHPRCHPARRRIAQSLQSNRVRAIAQLRLQHPRGEPDRITAAGPLSRSPRRHKAPAQINLSNTALNSPGELSSALTTSAIAFNPAPK
jgi:hypothetical protein